MNTVYQNGFREGHQQFHFYSGDLVKLSENDELISNNTTIIKGPVEHMLGKPGLYKIRRGEQLYDLAVNLPVSESNVKQFEVNDLESYKLIFTNENSDQTLEPASVLNAKKAEGEQQLWRYFIIVALCVILLESFLAIKTQQKMEYIENEA